jgi:predicted site-specific integrase-resolvase
MLMIATVLAGHLSTVEAARVLGVSQTWVNVFCKAGRLRYVETPLGKLVDRESVEALARKRLRSADPTPAA